MHGRGASRIRRLDVRPAGGCGVAVLAACPGQAAVWEAAGGDGGCADHQPEHPAIWLRTKQVLGRKRRNPEAFLAETAAELDRGSCLETVCGSGGGIGR